MKNYEVMRNYEKLMSLEGSDTKFSTKFLFTKAMNMSAMKNIVEAFEMAKNELVKKYGSVDESTGDYSVSLSNAEFKKEYEDLLNIEVGDVKIGLVNVEDLPSEMTSKEFSCIDFMVASFDFVAPDKNNCANNLDLNNVVDMLGKVVN